MALLHREFVYLWYYFDLQLRQIFWYWAGGMALGSAVSVFLKGPIRGALQSLGRRRAGLAGIFAASALGIASPLCMYGTIPLAASLGKSGLRQDWLAAFMMSSVLLNPQLIVCSAALGAPVLAVRLLSCFVCGAGAGLCVGAFCRGRPFFDFSGFDEPASRDTHPSLPLRYLKNLLRNLRATGPWFALGLALAALFQRYVPAGAMTALFGGSEAWGVLMAATVGVPLYACGGGTIPLLQEWLRAGISTGSAAAFMLTGPATKITNLGALKIVLGRGRFALYLCYVLLFSLGCGLLVNCIL